MSNSLTAFDRSYITQNRDLDRMNSISQKNNSGNSSFDKMLKQNISKENISRGNRTVNPDNLTGKHKKLYDTCQEMESLLWKQVLNAMKKNINKHKLIDGGRGEEIFSDFLYDEYASMISKHGNSGLSETMYKDMSRSL